MGSIPTPGISPALPTLVGRAGLIPDAGSGTRRRFGRTARDLVGQSLPELFPRIMLGVFATHYRAAFEKRFSPAASITEVRGVLDA